MQLCTYLYTYIGLCPTKQFYLFYYLLINFVQYVSLLNLVANIGKPIPIQNALHALR